MFLPQCVLRVSADSVCQSKGHYIGYIMWLSETFNLSSKRLLQFSSTDLVSKEQIHISWLRRGRVILFSQMSPGGSVTYTLTRSEIFLPAVLPTFSIRNYLSFILDNVFVFLLFLNITVCSMLWNMVHCCQFSCLCRWLVICSKHRPCDVHTLLRLYL